MEVVQPTLEIVAGILHSDLATLTPAKIEDAGAVDAIFDALQEDILNGVERLQLRDAALAKDELRGVLRRMREKFQCISGAGKSANSAGTGSLQGELDAFNAKIRAGLESAQWTAKRGGVGGGITPETGGANYVAKKQLAGDERLDTLKWILGLELLKVVNLLTSWNSTIDLNESNSFTFYSKQKLEIVKKELKISQRECAKYLQVET